MKYYFAKVIDDTDFDVATARVKDALQSKGFGVLTEIDVRKTLKEKIGAEFRNYRILGACNPKMAHQALQAEDKIGAMLPCNVIIQEIESGGFEVAAIDPVASMQAVENDLLAPIAQDVRDRLQSVIEDI